MTRLRKTGNDGPLPLPRLMAGNRLPRSQNKVLAIVEEEGAQRAAYALKLLQSEGVLTIASTGKDPTTGRLITHQYRVEGPVMICR